MQKYEESFAQTDHHGKFFNSENRLMYLGYVADNHAYKEN